MKRVSENNTLRAKSVTRFKVITSDYSKLLAKRNISFVALDLLHEMSRIVRDGDRPVCGIRG